MSHGNAPLIGGPVGRTGAKQTLFRSVLPPARLLAARPGPSDHTLCVAHRPADGRRPSLLGAFYMQLPSRALAWLAPWSAHASTVAAVPPLPRLGPESVGAPCVHAHDMPDVRAHAGARRGGGIWGIAPARSAVPISDEWTANLCENACVSLVESLGRRALLRRVKQLRWRTVCEGESRPRSDI